MSWFWDWYEEEHKDDENYPTMKFEKIPNKKSSRIRRREFVKNNK